MLVCLTNIGDNSGNKTYNFQTSQLNVNGEYCNIFDPTQTDCFVIISVLVWWMVNPKFMWWLRKVDDSIKGEVNFVLYLCFIAKFNFKYTREICNMEQPKRYATKTCCTSKTKNIKSGSVRIQQKFLVTKQIKDLFTDESTSAFNGRIWNEHEWYKHANKHWHK